MKTVELLESESLRLFNDLIVLNKLLGVYMRNSQDEDEVLLVDKWRNGFNIASGSEANITTPCEMEIFCSLSGTTTYP